MPELPPGYQDIPEEDRKKAKLFFDRGRTVAASEQFEYAIEMYIQGLNLDPELIEAHEALREISLRRKASGGKPLGVFSKGRLPKGTDDKSKMLAAEMQLAYDPGNMEFMKAMLQSAQKSGCYDTVHLFIGPILYRANQDKPKPDFATFILLKDVYTKIGRYALAVESCAAAVKLKPQDMDLAHDLKNLSTEATIVRGKYDQGSFRDSIKDMEAQKKLMEADKDVRTVDALEAALQDAEAAYAAKPADPSLFSKLIDALTKTERFDYENRAIELLDQMHKQTTQYKFRQRIGQIVIAQMNRQERTLREQIVKNPKDESLRKEHADFVREKAAEELRIFTETVENYPTDTTARFELGRRLFQLGRWDDAIPVFQQVRLDAKYKAPATILLGRAFLEAQFLDEAVETLATAIEEYPGRGDEKSKELTYWYGRSLEARGDKPAALKSYSQVFQWDARYRDVQVRIRALRTTGPGGPA